MSDNPTRHLAALIDHTLLKPDATVEDVCRLCEEARRHDFASVCIAPNMAHTASECLQESSVKTCTVIGFPLGSSTTPTKVFETKEAIENGADEVDMVLPIGRLKMGDHAYVVSDIQSVVSAADGRIVKVILETVLLNDDEKVIACRLCVKAGAHFVKTSTGFAGGGATVEDIQLIRRTVGPDVGVKASGGIRTAEDALAMIKAGASRLGTSAGVAIVTRPAVS